MLVLTREVEQTIILTTPVGPVTITLVEINGRKVRLGFEAPELIRIVRDDAKKGEKEKVTV